MKKFGILFALIAVLLTGTMAWAGVITSTPYTGGAISVAAGDAFHIVGGAPANVPIAGAISLNGNAFLRSQETALRTLTSGIQGAFILSPGITPTLTIGRGIGYPGLIELDITVIPVGAAGVMSYVVDANGILTASVTGALPRPATVEVKDGGLLNVFGTGFGLVNNAGNADITVNGGTVNIPVVPAVVNTSNISSLSGSMNVLSGVVNVTGGNQTNNVTATLGAFNRTLVIRGGEVNVTGGNTGGVFATAEAIIASSVTVEGGTLILRGSSAGNPSNARVQNSVIINGGLVRTIAGLATAEFDADVTVTANGRLRLGSAAMVAPTVQHLIIDGGSVSFEHTAASILGPNTQLIVRANSILDVATAAAGTGLRTLAHLNFVDAGGSTIRFTDWNYRAAPLHPDVAGGLFQPAGFVGYHRPLSPITFSLPAWNRAHVINDTIVIPLLTVRHPDGTTLEASDYRLNAEMANDWELKVVRTPGVGGVSILNLVPKVQINGVISPDAATAITIGATKSFDVAWSTMAGTPLPAASVATTSVPVTSAVADVTYTAGKLVVVGKTAGTVDVVVNGFSATLSLSGRVTTTFTVSPAAETKLAVTFNPTSVPINADSATTGTTQATWTYGTVPNPVVTIDSATVGNPDIATVSYDAAGKFTVTAKAVGNTTVSVKGHLTNDAKASNDATTFAVAVTKANVAPSKVIGTIPANAGVVAGADRLTATAAATDAKKVVLAGTWLNGYTIGTVLTGATGTNATVGKNASGDIEVTFPVSKDVASFDATVALVQVAAGTGVTGEIIKIIGSKPAQGTPGPTPSGSGGGCNTGYLPFIVLLAAPLYFLRKKD